MMGKSLLTWALLLALTWRQAGALYEDAEHVIVLSTKKDVETMLKHDGIWMVEFYSPQTQLQDLVLDYSAIASITRGIMHLAVVDVSTEVGEEMVSTYKVGSTFPALYIFGNDKTKPTKYRGKRDPNSLIQALMDNVVKTIQARGGSSQQQQKQEKKRSSGPSKVLTVTASNFKKEILDSPLVSMVAFIAPWCGHCKALEPEWEEAAAKLEGEGVLVGRVDATVEEELAGMFGVQGFPTIKVFRGGPGKTHNDAQDYQGERTAAAIVQYALAEVDRTGVPKEIGELVSQSVLDETCQGHNRICVLAALPHILDSGAAGRNKYRDMIVAVSKNFRGSAFQFLWFEGSSQPELEAATELTFGFPAVVALSLDRQAFAVLHGSFQEKSISAFLHGITTGRQPTVKMDKIPAIATVEPWDGQDGVLPEEEMDLADIMGDDWDSDSDGDEL